MSRAAFLLNGKFLSAGPTGVHRVAGELIRNLDQLLMANGGADDRDWSLLCPRDANRPLALTTIARRRVGQMTWQAWEQLELPRAARSGVLINLCNLAPLAHGAGVTMIHDAQVFISPESYSPAFRAWYRFALPIVGRRALRVLTVSNYSKARLVEFGVAPADKITVVHNGVDHLDAIESDPAVLDRLGLAPGGYAVATAGAQKHKNLAVLFRAFEAPALRSLSLVVAGPDDAAAFAAAGLTPPSNTIFAGRVTDGELRALYEQAACMAFPSTTEGFGLPPLEAMRLGCPAVVAPCGALPEVCGDAAAYAGAEDPAAWAEAILSLAEPGEARRRAQSLGPARSALYPWAASARKLLDVVEDVGSEALAA